MTENYDPRRAFDEYLKKVHEINEKIEPIVEGFEVRVGLSGVVEGNTRWDGVQYVTIEDNTDKRRLYRVGRLVSYDPQMREVDFVRGVFLDVVVIEQENGQVADIKEAMIDLRANGVSHVREGGTPLAEWIHDEKERERLIDALLVGQAIDGSEFEVAYLEAATLPDRIITPSVIDYELSRIRGDIPYSPPGVNTEYSLDQLYPKAWSSTSIDSEPSSHQ